VWGACCFSDKEKTVVSASSKSGNGLSCFGIGRTGCVPYGTSQGLGLPAVSPASRQPVRHVVALDTDPALLEVAAIAWWKAMKGSAISSWAMLKIFCGRRVRSARRETPNATGITKISGASGMAQPACAISKSGADGGAVTKVPFDFR
jgi:hypothetical protein